MSDSASDKKDLEQPVEAKLYSASILSSDENRFASTSVSHRKLESYHVNLIAIGGECRTRNASLRTLLTHR